MTGGVGVSLVFLLLAACAERPSSDWMGQVERQLAQREYRASSSHAGLQAPNRAHALRTWFEPTGIRVHDRTAGGHAALMGLSVQGVGRGSQLSPPAPGQVSSEGARVEIRREGFVEWYENSPAGLEQGFTWPERPRGEGPLAVELALSGASASFRGADLVFKAPGGRRLHYGALSARDAAGRLLAARMELTREGRVRLEVEDAGAAYPVVLDPLLTAAPDTQLESDQSGADLGTSVAGAGDVNGDGYADVIAGAPYYDAGETDEGAAFVFLGSAEGIADGDPATAKTQLESNQAYAEFGYDVAGAGDVNGDGYADVIVGAWKYDDGEPGEGAAFVFLGSATGIVGSDPATAATRLQSDQTGALFGNSVAGAGDVDGDGYADVIVGAQSYDAGEADEGAAFVFLGDAAGIADGNPVTAATQLESNQGTSRFGSVAGAGDVNGDGYADVIVGAVYYDAGESNEGAAFLFLGSGTGIADADPATADARIESNQASAYLGDGVAGAGDVNGDGYADVIVGASAYDAGESDEGVAFVFLGSGTGMAGGDPGTAVAWLESDQATAYMGWSVAGAGDVNGDGYADVIVGARRWDTAETDAGAAFVFLGGASGIVGSDPGTAAARLESDQQGAYLGTNVAGIGDVDGDGYADVIAGAPRHDAGEINEGASFVFLGGSFGIVSGGSGAAGAQLESDQAGARIGASVAGAGDVNGDGYADVIVGAPRYDAGQTDEGAAFVFLGSASGVGDGVPGSAAAQLESDQATARFGSSVAGAGDVNGDGYADVIVGAPYYDAGETDEGAAFLFLGSASGIANGTPATAATQLESDQADAYLGYAVAGAGDVNGDGYTDVIVGAPYYDAGENNEGAAFVFRGGAAGIASADPGTAAAQLESDQVDAYLGYAVAGAGDVNADGYADLIVGAWQYDAGETDEGAAFVFPGSPIGIADGDPGTAAARLESDQADAYLGASVAGAGDVDGDGYADVIVGAPYYDGGEGAAFVFRGGASGIEGDDPGTAATRLASDQTGAQFGRSVAGAGDVSGDGYADVIVGAFLHDAGEPGEGAAFVFTGGASGIAEADPGTAASRLESDQAYAHLGTSVAGAGDVNGDGSADVIVGAQNFDAGESNEGAAFVFLGNSAGRPVLAQQRRPDGSDLPVPPWGRSHDEGSFDVAMLTSHPEGRGRVKLEVEVCAPGVAFGDASCSNVDTAAWVSVGNGPGDSQLVSETVSGLAPDTLYRWRARLARAPASGPLPANPYYGPWRRPAAQSVEADIRVVPEPGQWLGIASGIALLFALHRRRMG